MPWRVTGTSTCRARSIHTIHRHVPLFLMVDKLMSIIYGELTTRHRFHRDSIQPDKERFPVEVMREAIVNMLMHRDYRHGQFTQIIRYDNRIEICNSGCSLKPDDMLGMKGSVTRNDTIARVCHDTKLAETKGSGIDRMWRKMVEAGLSRPTMESDHAAATFTIRLLLCHFFSEETLDWHKRFAAYELNDRQRTALVFMREVGAIDAVAYRQLTGCNTKSVAKELAGIKDQGLMIQKGCTRGTYYVPSEILLEDIKETTLNSWQVEAAPACGETAPVRRGNTSTQRNYHTSACNYYTSGRNEYSSRRNEYTSGRNEYSSRWNDDTSGRNEYSSRCNDDTSARGRPGCAPKKIAALKRRVPSKVMQSVIVELCAVRAMGRIELSKILKRSLVTIDRLVAPLIGKELDYLYPMMVHHPRQAYVALDKRKGTS